MSDKLRRWQRVRDLIRRGGVHSQDQLAILLRREGIEATQATLSRDLRELGVMKGAGGYLLPDGAPSNGSGTSYVQATSASVPAGGATELEAALRTYLMRADCGGTMVVLHTGPGQASALASELDRASLRSVLGTVAGDDTVLVATRSPRAAAGVVTSLKQLAGLR